MRVVACLAVFLPALAIGAAAQPVVLGGDPTDVVRYLIPVATSVTGALGSSWQTDVTASNQSTVPVTIARVSIDPLRSGTLSFNRAGEFVDVPREIADAVTLTIRVRDLSRNADSLGVEVPAVPESQFRRSIVLNSIPSTDGYRAMLRIYGDGGSENVIIRLRDAVNGTFLQEFSATLNGDSPSYLEVPLPETGTSPQLIEVTPSAATQPPIWAFVSVTNNVTQQVTLVTPRIESVPAPPPPSDLLSVGHWGGKAACMDVTDSQVTLVTICAGGEFVRPSIDPDGHFEADGTWKGGIGPVPPGPGVPAHFSGIVRGNEAVVLAHFGSTTTGPLTVDLGATTPCPVPCP